MSAMNNEKNALLRSKIYNYIWNLFKNSDFAITNIVLTVVFCYLSSKENCLLVGHFLPFISFSDYGQSNLLQKKKKRQHHSNDGSFLSCFKIWANEFGILKSKFSFCSDAVLIFG